jgi:hypothetical protein
MEHRDDAPLADEPRSGAIPNDQPAGGPTGPEDPDTASDVEVHGGQPDPDPQPDRD